MSSYGLPSSGALRGFRKLFWGWFLGASSVVWLWTGTPLGVDCFHRLFSSATSSVPWHYYTLSLHMCYVYMGVGVFVLVHMCLHVRMGGVGFCVFVVFFPFDWLFLFRYSTLCCIFNAWKMLHQKKKSWLHFTLRYETSFTHKMTRRGRTFGHQRAKRHVPRNPQCIRMFLCTLCPHLYMQTKSFKHTFVAHRTAL